MKGVNIFLADGFEDVEALGTRDVLVRGGVEVNLVGIDDEKPLVESSHGVLVAVDSFLGGENIAEGGEDASDVMIFPGGMPGSRNLASCGSLIDSMNRHSASGGAVAAICAAPGLVLSQLVGAQGSMTFTCFDSFERYCPDWSFDPRPAITSGRIITGRSAGHAFAFGLEILAFLKGNDVAAKVRHDLYL